MSDPRLTMRLRANVSVESDGATTSIHHPWGTVVVAGPPWVTAMLHGARDELDTDGILDLLIEQGVDDEDSVAVALSELDDIVARMPMVIERSVYDGDRAVLRLIPIGMDAPVARATELEPGSVLWMDRHAYLRRVPGVAGLSLESPLAHHRAWLAADLVALLGRAADGDLSASDVAEPAPRTAVALLVSVGLLHAGPTSEPVAESSWRFHDLLFHARSRQGRTDEVFGALSGSDVMVPPPPVAAHEATSSTQLSVPRFDDVVRTDLTLTEALESRRSIREYADEPVTVEELGELLYRVARIRAITQVPFHDGYEGIDRPYPTGGMAGDLEVYVTAARCAGLGGGSYRYDAVRHRLDHVASLAEAQPLLMAARIATGLDLEPQLLLTFTSRFARTSWKYGSIAYALTLKHVGVLMQTVYLVATSMGLAPCALGSGNADGAATVFGLDYLEESSVGEMLLGRPRDLPTRAARFRDLSGSPTTSSER